MARLLVNSVLLLLLCSSLCQTSTASTETPTETTTTETTTETSTTETTETSTTETTETTSTTETTTPYTTSTTETSTATETTTSTNKSTTETTTPIATEPLTWWQISLIGVGVVIFVAGIAVGAFFLVRLFRAPTAIPALNSGVTPKVGQEWRPALATADKYGTRKRSSLHWRSERLDGAPLRSTRKPWHYDWQPVSNDERADGSIRGQPLRRNTGQFNALPFAKQKHSPGNLRQPSTDQPGAGIPSFTPELLMLQQQRNMMPTRFPGYRVNKSVA